MTQAEDVVSTGIEGLDDILLGGFSRNHVYLLQCARNGEKALCITLSETESELQAVARSIAGT